MSFFKLNYYAHPEGKDLLGKLLATNKYAFIAGLWWSTADTLMISKTKGYGPTLARYAYNTVPLMGMATAFTAATYAATNFREKDDRLNYFIGGMAAGGMYGAIENNIRAAFVVGVILGMAGVVKKTSIQEGWLFFPDNSSKRQYGGLVANDWTLTAERPRNWTIKEEEA